MRRPVILLVLLAILGLFACCAGGPKERNRNKLLPGQPSLQLNVSSSQFRQVVQQHTRQRSTNSDQSHPGMSNSPNMINFGQPHHPNPDMSNMPTPWRNSAGSANMTQAFQSQQYHPAVSTQRLNPAGNNQWTVPAGSTQSTNRAGNTQSTNPAGSTQSTNPAGNTQSTNRAGYTQWKNPNGRNSFCNFFN